MNILGAVLLLFMMTVIGIGAWIALEQRLGLITKLRAKLPVLKNSPWLVVAVMLGAVLLIGLFLLAVRAPEAVYYVIGGLLVGSVIMLVTTANN